MRPHPQLPPPKENQESLESFSPAPFLNLPSLGKRLDQRSQRTNPSVLCPPIISFSEMNAPTSWLVFPIKMRTTMKMMMMTTMMDWMALRRNPRAKKRKRPPHGKIGFESLAKIVGQRWKELKPDELAKYKKLADVDMVRYRAEMESYVAKQREGLEQSREQLDNLVDSDGKNHYFGDN
mmetsp:Transcript_331/g.665  ORF Transcript_331/g.665 Transcript_331/m.665 type:complete len:179 (-) Transcript_331:269-805(-)